MKKSLTKMFLAFVLSACGVAWAQETPKPETEGGKVANERAVDASTLLSPSGESSSLLSAPKESAANAFGLTFALFAGRDVDEKSPMRLPSFSKNDVANFATLLKTKNGLFDRNAATMTSDEEAFYLKPKRENILSMLRRVAEEAREADSIWVVFSGDGVSYEGDAAFLPQGATIADPSTWIFESEVREILAASRAKKIVSVWLTHRRIYKVENPTPRERRAIEPKDGAERVAIFACSTGGSAWEAHERKLDLFASEFLNAANAVGKPLQGETLRRVFDEAAAKTREATKDNELGVQTPEWQAF